MHKITLKMFDLLRQTLDFIKLVVIFCTMLFLLYWTMHLIGAKWKWIGFIVPFFDSLLDFSGKITDTSFYLFKALFEVKYFLVVVMFSAVAFILKLSVDWVYEAERIYKNTRLAVKKINEDAFNRQLYNERKKEEKALNNYIVIIYTQLSKKGMHTENLDEQNRLMNDFIKSKTGVEYVSFEHGFMYQFTNFENIDNVLKVLFKVINSSAPLNYAICIQIEKDLKKLNKLIELKQFGKITIAADTAYRYSFNRIHQYETLPVGVFQHADGTLEIHEFKDNI